MSDILKAAKTRLAEIRPIVNEGVRLQAMIRAGESALGPIPEPFVFEVVGSVPAGTSGRLEMTFPVAVRVKSFDVDPEIAEHFSIADFCVGRTRVLGSACPVPAKEFTVEREFPIDLAVAPGMLSYLTYANTSHHSHPFRLTLRAVDLASPLNFDKP